MRWFPIALFTNGVFCKCDTLRNRTDHHCVHRHYVTRQNIYSTRNLNLVSNALLTGQGKTQSGEARKGKGHHEEGRKQDEKWGEGEKCENVHCQKTNISMYICFNSLKHG